MELTVTFDGGTRLSCHVGDHVLAVDQPVEEGGQAAAPSPSEYFLASLLTCGAYYVLSFCESRDIPMDDVAMSLKADLDEDKKLYGSIEYRVRVGEAFPDKYHKALARSVGQCFVKKHFENPPEFAVTVEPGS
jgi:uncharacterized OsmC-like protein